MRYWFNLWLLLWLAKSTLISAVKWNFPSARSQDIDFFFWALHTHSTVKHVLRSICVGNCFLVLELLHRLWLKFTHAVTRQWNFSHHHSSSEIHDVVNSSQCESEFFNFKYFPSPFSIPFLQLFFPAAGNFNWKLLKFQPTKLLKLPECVLNVPWKIVFLSIFQHRIPLPWTSDAILRWCRIWTSKVRRSSTGSSNVSLESEKIPRRKNNVLI